MEQNWGGVQSIDPSGRIWFWRAYPYILKWYDSDHGITGRHLPDHEDWLVKSWDVWGSDFYLILTSKSSMIKKRVDPITLEIKSGPPSTLEETVLFMGLMPVDIYHQGNMISSVYYNLETFEFYQLNNEERTVTFLGRWNPGDFKVLGPQYSKNMIIWKEGQKVFGIVDLTSGDVRVNDINAPNISRADITALVLGNDGYLYGGGALTISDMFKYNPVSNDVVLLKQAIPDGEGQVNSLFEGLDGNIYGAGYPDSVIFKYDPSLPWSPGDGPSSNPVNVGPLGHYNQMRAHRGIQDLEGNIWYQSVGDYAYPIVHALAKVNFTNRNVIVKTDIRDGFPVVKGLAVYDDTNILLLGEKDNEYKLYVLDQREFVIKKEHEIEMAGGLLVNLDPKNPDAGMLFLAHQNILYRVHKNLSLQPIHKARGPIVNILRGRGRNIILIGQNYISMIDNISGDWQVWWDTKVLQHLAWPAAVLHDDVMFIADGEKLKKFILPK